MIREKDRKRRRKIRKDGGKRIEKQGGRSKGDKKNRKTNVDEEKMRKIRKRKDNKKNRKEKRKKTP